MKKQLVAALMGGVLSACTSTVAEEREAYRQCLNQAEGVASKIKGCQPLLAALNQQPRHRAFVQRETVRMLDYQRCLDAEQMGGGELIHSRCQRVWKEIKQNNQ